MIHEWSTGFETSLVNTEQNVANALLLGHHYLLQSRALWPLYFDKLGKPAAAPLRSSFVRRRRRLRE